jgi:hypothetical protein
MLISMSCLFYDFLTPTDDFYCIKYNIYKAVKTCLKTNYKDEHFDQPPLHPLDLFLVFGQIFYQQT